MNTESLINDLQNQIKKLEKDLSQAEENIKDFEKLALIWQDSYRKMEKKYKTELANREQTIEQLEKDLNEIQARLE